MTIKIDLSGTENFQKLLGIMADFLKDDRVPKEVRRGLCAEIKKIAGDEKHEQRA